MTWTIPLVMSNLNNNPQNQYGLVGVVTLNLTGTNPNTYGGTIVFTKPGNAFANQQFPLQNVQYLPTGLYANQLYFEIGSVVNGPNPIQLAQQFNSNGGFNPPASNNPPVNTQGLPPVFSFHAPWDGQSSTFANGQARLPRRLLAAYGQGHWQQIQFSGDGSNTGGGPDLSVFSDVASTGTMLYLTNGQFITFQINLTPVTGVVIIVNMQSTAAAGQITVSASSSSTSNGTTIGSYTPRVDQYGIQAFFIPSTNFQTGNNYITVKNTGPTSVYFQKATFAW